MTDRDFLLITCEHGGNRIPAAYRPLFRDHAALLDSHRGHDPGALSLARDLAGALQAPLYYATVSRLVIDLNRSIGHPRLFSEITRPTAAALRREILERHYLPYRHRVEAAVAEAVGRGHRVLHVASHSFTPVLDGVVRNADLGLLYDPRRPGEVAFCRGWRATLDQLPGHLKVRLNYPYRGRADGLTAYLRRRFPADVYVGIELEVNQRRVKGKGWGELRRQLVESLRLALAG